MREHLLGGMKMVTPRGKTRFLAQLPLARPIVARMGRPISNTCSRRRTRMKDLKMPILGFLAGQTLTFSMLDGCASNGWLPPTNMDGQYHTVTLPERYKNQNSELAVLIGRNARIEGANLIYGCFYQTQKGVVRIDQGSECQPTRKNSNGSAEDL
jgi:hypothetical protein